MKCVNLEEISLRAKKPHAPALKCRQKIVFSFVVSIQVEDLSAEQGDGPDIVWAKECSFCFFWHILGRKK